MAKSPETNLYVPDFTPLPFSFASSPPSNHLNVMQQRIQQDLLRLYRLSKELNDTAGTGATRVAIGASNFTQNHNELAALDRRNRILDHIRSDGAAYITSPSFTDADKLRVITVPLDINETFAGWTVGGDGMKDLYQNTFDGMLMGQMTSVSHRLADPGTAITFTATDSSSVSLIDADTTVDRLFDQSKETSLVFVVDKDISSEDGATDKAWEEISISITSADLAKGYNAVQIEFGLPMTLSTFGYSTGPTDLVDEAGDSLSTTAGYLDGLYLPLENITRRTIYVQNPGSNQLQMTIRSSNWIPYNDAGTIKKRFIFPIYSIDCVDYSVTSGTSYGIARVRVPKEYTNPTGDSDVTFYGDATISTVVDAGCHMYPQILRETSTPQIDMEVFANASAATALAAAKQTVTSTTHAVSGAAQDFYVRLITTSGTYVPRIEAVDFVYEIS